MNILLVEINTFIPAAVPLSLAYLAAFVRNHGFNVRIIALGEGTPFSLQSLKQLLDDFQPRLVGLSAYQRNIPFVLGLTKTIKAMKPSVKIIIGGPQATFMPSVAIERSLVDFICREEGERALLNAAIAVDSNVEPSPVAGCAGKGEDGRFREGPSIEACPDLDAYPSPYLTPGLIDFTTMDEAIMLTSRGCPYQCIFCYTPHAFKRQVRFHSIERVVEEMAWIHRNGVHKFWFADPSFSFNMRRVDQLMEQIIHQDLKAQIWLETRADLIEAELLMKMKAAGVRQIAFGLESASERVLTTLKKNISLQHVRRAIELTRKHGIGVELFSQYGLPNETVADALMTLQFVKDNHVPIQGNTNPQQTQIYFGTELYNNHEQWGIRPLEQQRPPYISIGDQYETSCLSIADIQKIKEIWQRESLDGGKRKVS